jgi:osmotically inducible lipoprotein OsmB
LFIQSLFTLARPLLCIRTARARQETPSESTQTNRGSSRNKILLGACATPPTNTEIGVATGAVIGGAVGAVLTGGSTFGTVAGAGAGAVVGHEIGKRTTR